MRHYEIVIIMRPEMSEKVEAKVNQLKAIIKDSEKQRGKIHRYEDWGVRTLAYPIKKLTKAHYILFNIETNHNIVAELEATMRYDDTILRYLVVRRNKAIKKDSVILLKKIDKERQERINEANELRRDKQKSEAIKKANEERINNELTQTNEDQTSEDAAVAAESSNTDTNDSDTQKD